MSAYGDILTVDLTSRGISRAPLPEAVVCEVLGGRGLNARELRESVGPEVDPLGPDNMLLLTSGLLTGSVAPASSRLQLAARSPQTGLIGMSNVGGHFGATLRRAGIATLRIVGRAPAPVALWIEREQVHIRDASGVWGMEIPAAIAALQAQAPDAATRVLAIGPGGENLVRYASIIADDGHAAGRTGLGTVMGSKQLKAIVVAEMPHERAARNELSALARDYALAIRESERYGIYSTTSNNAYLRETHDMGLLGTRNFQQVQFEHVDAVNGTELMPYLHKHKSCPRCPVHCKAEVRVAHGRFEAFTGERPDIEPLMGFGPRIGVADPEAVLYLYNLTNLLGIDSISAAGVVAFAMELYEQEILSPVDTGGLPLRWGDAEAAAALLGQIARREGLGDALAEGVREAARRIGDGAERYAYHSKGLELPGYDPRGAQGTALAFAISNRGADYATVYPSLEYFWTAEEGEAAFGDARSVDRMVPDAKGRMVRYSAQVSAVLDALGVCKVPILSVVGDFSLEPEAALVSAATGWSLTPDDLFRVGAEIITAERRLNIRYGLTSADDTLPAHFLEDPVPSGPTAGQVVELDGMVCDFYRAMGWNEDGVPPEEVGGS